MNARHTGGPRVARGAWVAGQPRRSHGAAGATPALPPHIPQPIPAGSPRAPVARCVPGVPVGLCSRSAPGRAELVPGGVRASVLPAL